MHPHVSDNMNLVTSLVQSLWTSRPNVGWKWDKDFRRMLPLMCLAFLYVAGSVKENSSFRAWCQGTKGNTCPECVSMLKHVLDFFLLREWILEWILYLENNIRPRNTDYEGRDLFYPHLSALISSEDLDHCLHIEYEDLWNRRRKWQPLTPETAAFPPVTFVGEPALHRPLSSTITILHPPSVFSYY